jgi:hypothetical protein
VLASRPAVPLVSLCLFTDLVLSVSARFVEELSTLLEYLITLSLPVMITGDVHIRLNLPSDLLSRRFNDLLVSFGLVNDASLPLITRAVPWTSSWLGLTLLRPMCRFLTSVCWITDWSGGLWIY